MNQTIKDIITSRQRTLGSRGIGVLITAGAATLGIGACATQDAESTSVGRTSQPIVEAPLANTCGYTLTTGFHQNNMKKGWVEVTNVSGEPATDFSVLVYSHGVGIKLSYDTDYEAALGGYVFSAPDELTQNPLQQGDSVSFEFKGTDRFESLTAHLLSVNGESCKFFGTASDAPEGQTGIGYFTQLTPENAGKWGSVEATRGDMSWAGLDAAYGYAHDNGLRFKLHTLLWGQQQPDWIGDLSAEEQLAEIDEWMAAIAERYPEIEMIDVVNEPMHAVPSYSEALGGAGETGYDWVITAFEMAREHFPQSKLILNDYNVLVLENFTADYLGIIELLQERNLIDGIGVQAHFLERAELSVVEANLDALGATGLPIYVSEFDVNFADDARQANVFAGLAELMLTHSAVDGVTHWGHLEGSIWRSNAYLVRADGTARPALEWLVCFMNGGQDCPLPEYVPSGWQGGEYGLTLQAEEYDEGQGLAALGSTVAYTDEGDWIRYIDVEFQDTWDTFWITYAKGNEELGSISLHLDSLDSDAILTVPLPNSGSWGSNATIELPFTPLNGVHDVFVRFNDVEGVANVDSLRFGTPPPEVNLVIDGGFEDGGGTWGTWAGATLTRTTDQAYEGDYSLMASDATSSSQRAIYDLTSVVSPNTTYAVSAQAMHQGVGPETLRLSAKIECEDPPDGHNTYPWLHNLNDVEPNQWTTLSGNLVIPDCTVKEVLLFFFEGTTAETVTYLDAVKVAPPDGNLVTDGGFEAGGGQWGTWAGATLAVTTDYAYEGSYSLGATDASSSSQRAIYDVTALVSPDTTYSVSAQAMHVGPDPDTLRLSAKIECEDPPEGHNTYPWLQNLDGVEALTWTPLSGNLVIPDCTIKEVLVFFFEGTTAEVDTYLDDVQISPQ